MLSQTMEPWNHGTHETFVFELSEKGWRLFSYYVKSMWIMEPSLSCELKYWRVKL